MQIGVQRIWLQYKILCNFCMLFNLQPTCYAYRSASNIRCKKKKVRKIVAVLPHCVIAALSLSRGLHWVLSSSERKNE